MKIARALALMAVAGVVSSCLTDTTREEYRPASRDQSAQTSIAVFSVVRWDDIATKLEPNFTLSATEALAQAVPTAAAGNITIRDAFGFSVQAGLPTSTTTKSAATTITDGVASATSTKIKTSGPGTIPDASDLADPGSQVGKPINGPAFEPGVDPILRHDMAKSLMEHVQVLNQAVRHVAMDPEEEEAYLVRMRVGLIPLARYQPYDVHTRMSFFLKEDVVSASKVESLRQTLRQSRQQTLSKVKSGENDIESDIATVQKNLATAQQRTLNKPPAPDNNAPLRILPLLVTDNLEASLQSRSEDQIRQLGLALSLMMNNVGANIGAEKLKEILKTFQAREYSSLHIVSPLVDNTLQARFGAQSNSRGSFSMQERNQDITLLVIAPKSSTETKRAVQILARISMRDPSKKGEILPRPSRQAVLERMYSELRPIFMDDKIPDVAAGYDSSLVTCTEYDLGTVDTTQRTRVLLSRLYYTVIENNTLCFREALDAAGWSQYGHWQTIWNEIAGIVGMSEYSRASFWLPKRVKPTFSNQASILLLDDGKQASRAAVEVGPKVVPAQIRTSIRSKDGDLLLYGAVSAGPASDLISLQFASLADAGLSPADAKLLLQDLEDPKNKKEYDISYRIAPVAAHPGFKLSQAVKSVGMAPDSTGSVSLKITFAGKDEKGPDGKPLRADKVILTAVNAEIEKADTGVVADNAVTITTDGTAKLSLRNLAVGQTVTIKATGKRGAGDTAPVQTVEFAVTAPK